MYDEVAVRNELDRALAHPPNYIDNEFDNNYVKENPALDTEQAALAYMQNELIWLQYLQSLSRFDVGVLPPAELTVVANFARTCMLFPRYPLQLRDARPEYFSGLPSTHHLREQLDPPKECKVCHKEFNYGCDLLAHHFGKSHLKAFRNQPLTCPTCHESLAGTSVADHIYTKKHLEARLELLTGKLLFIMPYWPRGPGPGL